MRENVLKCSPWRDCSLEQNVVGTLLNVIAYRQAKETSLVGGGDYDIRGFPVSVYCFISHQPPAPRAHISQPLGLLVSEGFTC